MSSHSSRRVSASTVVFVNVVAMAVISAAIRLLAASAGGATAVLAAVIAVTIVAAASMWSLQRLVRLADPPAQRPRVDPVGP